jgi:hypothetical protein
MSTRIFRPPESPSINNSHLAYPDFALESDHNRSFRVVFDRNDQQHCVQRRPADRRNATLWDSSIMPLIPDVVGDNVLYHIPSYKPYLQYILIGNNTEGS